MCRCSLAVAAKATVSCTAQEQRRFCTPFQRRRTSELVWIQRLNALATESPMMAMSGTQRRLGWWRGERAPPCVDEDALEIAVQHVGRSLYVLDVDGRLGIARDGVSELGTAGEDASDGFPLVGFAPALSPEQLGDQAFHQTHGVQFAYIAGAMANGIASVEMVEAMARAGMLGFFGAGGLEIDRIAAAIDRLQHSLDDAPFGFNLIHSPQQPRHEAETVELYLRRGISLVSAAAYMDLTEPLVHYRVSGLHRDAEGRVVAPNRVIAKVSRIEVARRFFSPPPEGALNSLVQKGLISAEEAALARHIPMAEDLTAEADSGGHTDNRPALALLPTIMALRDQLQTEFGYARPLRVGAAGGIATPAAAAAAFSMGAAYVLTGTINQACVESGTSDAVRKLLAKAKQADVAMAPAADMFELGACVQVLKRGTMFAIRARKLHELYRNFADPDEIPPDKRLILERDYFRAPLAQAWELTREFFLARDPTQIERAERDPKHKLALLCRAYLGQASRWANTGEPSRRMDYQIWCGPAMGAFNEWTRGSFLEPPESRCVVTVALNLMVGAAALTRAGWLRTQGVPLTPAARRFVPQPRAELTKLIQG